MARFVATFEADEGEVLSWFLRLSALLADFDAELIDVAEVED